MGQLYQFVGPPEIANAVSMTSRRLCITSGIDVRRWMADFSDEREMQGSITVTFIIDEIGRLWIADRRSEHVACACGGRVRSAGEITFAISKNNVDATYVTNQSTGYCPEPESWPEVASALDSAGIGRSDNFDASFDFRRCPCGQISIVKNGVFECCVCRAELPRDWNLAPTTAAKPGDQPDRRIGFLLQPELTHDGRLA